MDQYMEDPDKTSASTWSVSWGKFHLEIPDDHYLKLKQFEYFPNKKRVQYA